MTKDEQIKKLKSKLSVELRALADRDKNIAFYQERINELEGLLARCQADAEKIAEQRDVAEGK